MVKFLQYNKQRLLFKLLNIKSNCFNKVHSINYHRGNVKSFDEIPGPSNLQIFGGAFKHFFLERGPLDIVKQHAKLNEIYGDICVIRNPMGLQDVVLIYNADDIETVLRNEGKWPVRLGFNSLMHYRNSIRGKIFGTSIGLANSQGEAWYNLRSQVNPILMKPQTVRRYVSVLDEIASVFIERMKLLAKMDEKSEMPKNFYEELCKWAFETISFVGLDQRMGALGDIPNSDGERMVAYMMELTKLLRTLDFSPIGHYCVKYNLPPWRTFVKYQDYFTDKVLKYMDEAKIKQHIDESQNEESVFRKLLNVDEKVALVVTLDLLSAGIDTTGKFMAAILYHLSKHVEAQKKLRGEIIKYVPMKSTPITNEILSNLRYLRAVIKEVGRISPVSSVHSRSISSDLVLSGYHIPKMKRILVPTLYLSNTSNYYIRPKDFIPERWLRTTEGELSAKNVKKFITIPFGFGPRSCVGRRFATLEVEVLLTKIIRNFELRWNYPEMRFGEDMFYGVKDPLRIQIKDNEH